jgi:predicted nucleotidyltransferase
MRDLDRQHILNTACGVLAKALPEVWAIYAFGSFARGDEWPDSDLDLGVLMAPKVGIPDKLGLTAEVSRQAGREVDIVNLRSVSLDLVHQVLREGRQLLVTRADDVLCWEAERMTEYAEFNPRRADIVALYLSDPVRASS